MGKLAVEELPDETMELEAAVDMAIAACGGDPREAVRALITANTFLNHEVERLQKLVSPGFARGRLAH